MAEPYIPSLGMSLRLLATRRFGTFWFASLLSNIGTWAQQVAQPWLLLSIGASSFLIGLDSFALNAPVWFLTILGGALADSGNRRNIIVKFQSIQLLCPLLIVLLLLLAQVKPWLVIILSLVIGITDALSMPSFQSIVPTMVGRAQLGAGLALNATQFNLSRILGPAIAGLLLVSMGLISCFVLSAVSYLPFIAVAVWILPRQVAAKVPSQLFDSHKIWSNVRHISHLPILRGALLTVFASSLLCAPLITFIPVLIKHAFHGNASQFSLAIGAFGVGGVVGAVALLFVPASFNRQKLCAWSAGCYGLLVILTTFNAFYWGLILLLVFIGICTSVLNISANTLIQSNVASDMRGQAVSLYMLALRGGLAMGSLITGISISVLNVNHALLLNGILAMLAQFLLSRVWFRVKE